MINIVNLIIIDNCRCHAGSTQAVVDGFYVFLQPLSSGKHELHFGALTPPASSGGSPFIVDVTYHLTVQ
jgi:hypothetical protein